MRIAFACAFVGGVACGGGHVAPDPVAAACVSARTSAELACVASSATREASDACVARVQSSNNCVADAGEQ
jgi:hypothetical protein